MAGSKGSKMSRTAVWALLVLLVLGLAGFGVNSLGNTLTTIAYVGETPISINQYQRALRQKVAEQSQARGAQLSMSDAMREGLDRQVRTELVGTAAMIEEARVMGLSVGDAQVLRQLKEIPAFHDAAGQFDRASYEFTLERNGLNPKVFEQNLRDTAASGLLQQAVVSGLTTNPEYSATLYNFLAQKRSYRWVELKPEALTGPNPEPTQEQLQSFYDEHGDRLFRVPAKRQVSYAWLTPDMLLDEAEPNEDHLKTLYEERAETYNQPERRMIERLVFADEAEAKAAKAKLDAGETTFEALVEGRGLSLQDVDQGEVAKADLSGPEAEAIFALDEPGLTAPVATKIGPAIFRINAVLEANVIPFEDAREELVEEAASDQAQRMILDMVADLDDRLAGGATLEDLGKETDMEYGELEFTGDESDGIAKYDNFRSEVTALKEGDFPEIRELSDGGIFAVRLNEIIPSTIPPLPEIREQVAQAWQKAETKRRLAELGETLKNKLDKGDSMEALKLSAKTETDAQRTDFIEGIPPALITEAFRLPVSKAAVVSAEGRVFLVKLLDISNPDLEGEEAKAMITRFASQGNQSMALDVFETFTRHIQQQHGLTFNERALSAVHSQF